MRIGEIADRAVDYAAALSMAMLTGDWDGFLTADQRLNAAVHALTMAAISASSGAATELDYYGSGQ